ncbi:transcription factor gte9 [Phtheirospermum japonicum]|uniref:Transcription factor gte9 n=1 Tax=Phtheirospermum japonicum TaxID=374723 RepID=A0A830BK01_9LAMI|nr:transcription factor gte9 [Phtheirospermum japonicum]
MAPTIPIDYAGQRESKKFSNRGSGGIMGKTRKVSKGNSTGFVPDYRHAVETVAESEGFGRSGRGGVELPASQDPCAPNRKCISLNMDGFDRSVVPIQHLPLSKMSPSERRDLEIRLKSELEKVMKLQRKIASFSLDAMARLPAAPDVRTYHNGPKGHAMAESLSMGPVKKKGPPGRNGPRTKGGAVSANKRNEPVKQGPKQSSGFVMLLKQCETLLARLMAHPQCWIFNEPVDIVKHNIPDYFTIIKHPMDLGTVQKKLLSNHYSNPMDFAADVRLTFKNAMTYNPKGHVVHDMADEMNKFFDVRWKPIEKKIPSTADESTAEKSSVIVETESAYVPPSKKQKTVSMENHVKREKDNRVMSDDEKQKLGVDLEELLAELPDNIITFLKESTSNSSQVSEDEIEIEIDALSDEILFKLRKLLDDYLIEKQKNQTMLEPCKIEMRKESGLNSSSIHPCKDNEPADEDVDIGINDPPPSSSSPLIKTDENAAPRNIKCSSSRSSGSESGSSSTDSDSGSSSDSELDGDKNSVLASTANGTADAKVKQKECDPNDPNNEDFLNGNAEKNTESNPSSTEPYCQREGESAPQERQVSPDKLYRAALLRSRFADIIIKAQENSIDKGEKPDPERLKREKDELEKRRKEEKARLQAEAKAAEEARKKAEVEAAAEAKRKRELEREAARQALLKIEKTVEINESSQFMEDLEMFRSAPDEPLLQSFIEAASPENSQNGLGSFKFQASSNPLEQLGLYMKNDDEEEEEIEPESNLDASNDPEEGEID